jgi:DUF971 family protein
LNNDDEALSIEWSDGVTHRLGWEMLRARCPCATCRTKVDEPPSLLPVMAIEEATPTRGTAVKPVGNYAYNIQFTDGHNTGIYTLDYLLALGRASV